MIQYNIKYIILTTCFRALAIAEPLNILLSCSGLSMLMFYSVTIFEEAGAAVDKLTASVIVSAFRVLIAITSSIALLKLPRRPLFLSSTLLVCLAMFCLGLAFHLRSKVSLHVSHRLLRYNHNQEYFEELRWVPLALIIIIFAGGQLGFSPIVKVRGDF